MASHLNIDLDIPFGAARISEGWGSKAVLKKNGKVCSLYFTGVRKKVALLSVKFTDFGNLAALHSSALLSQVATGAMQSIYYVWSYAVYLLRLELCSATKLNGDRHAKSYLSFISKTLKKLL